MEVEQRVSMENNSSLDSIDLDNRMRTIYIQRVKSAEKFRETVYKNEETESKISTNKGNSLSGITSAMDRLRNEMVSLVDQDVSFLKQMLLMNERIEEIKSRRSFYKPKSHRKYSERATKVTPESTTTKTENQMEEENSFNGLRRMSNFTNLADDKSMQLDVKCKTNARSGRDSGYYESDSSDEED